MASASSSSTSASPFPTNTVVNNMANGVNKASQEPTRSGWWHLNLAKNIGSSAAEGAAEQIRAIVASMLPSNKVDKVGALLSKLKEHGLKNPNDAQGLQDILNSLNSENLSSKQREYVKKVEQELIHQESNPNPSALKAILQEPIEENGSDITSLLGNLVSLWKGEKGGAGGTGLIESIVASIMGAPEQPLGAAKDALEKFADNATSETALQSLLDAAAEKKVLKETQLSDAEIAAIQELIILAKRDLALTREQIAPVLAILKAHCDKQIANGILPRSIAWTSEQAPAQIKRFWFESALPTGLEVISEKYIGPIDQEAKLASYVDEFCKEGFVAPPVPEARRKSLERERENFVAGTVDILLNDYRPFTKPIVRPLLTWYVKGFEKNGFNFFSALTKVPGNDAEKDLQLDLLEKVQFNLIDHLKIYFTERFAKEGKVTPAALMQEMTAALADRFAPRFQFRENVKNYFQGKKFLAPLSWILQGFSAIADTIVNGIATPILKWILVRNQLIPTLLEKTKDSLGFGKPHTHGLDIILAKQLNNGLTILKKGGTPQPAEVNKNLEDRLTEVVNILMKTLDAGIVKGPEAQADPVAAKRVEKAIVAQITGLLQFVFTRENLEQQVHTVYEILNNCYNPGLPPTRATILAKEKEVSELQEKIIFISTFLTLEQEMDKPAGLRREAARFLETVRKKVIEKDIGFTEEDLTALEQQFLNNKLLENLPETDLAAFTNTTNTLRTMIKELREASDIAAQRDLSIQSEEIQKDLETLKLHKIFYKAIKDKTPYVSFPADIDDREVFMEHILILHKEAKKHSTLKELAKGLPVEIDDLESADQIEAQKLQGEAKSEWAQRRLNEYQEKYEQDSKPLRLLAKTAFEKTEGIIHRKQIQIELNKRAAGQRDEKKQSTVTALQQWKGSFNAFTTMGVKPLFDRETGKSLLDSKSLITLGARIGFPRYMPLVRHALTNVVKKGDFLDGVAEHLVIRPFLGK